MTNKITMELDAREARIVAAWQRSTNSIEMHNRELSRIGNIQDRNQNSSKRFFNSSQRGLSQVTQEIGRFASAMLGLGALVQGTRQLIQVLQQERQVLEERQERSRLASLSPAEALRRARLNFQADDTLGDDRLESTALRIAKKRRTELATVATALGTAFSAKGELSNEIAVDAVDQAFRALPNDLEAGSTLAGRALDVAKVQQANGKEVDIRAILGFLQNVANNARVTSLDKVGSTAVPAIASLALRGDSPEQAGELFSTLTQLLKDEEGRKSSTAAINLGTRLGGFVPNKQGKDERGRFKVPQQQIEQFELAQSTTERISVLQQSPELRRQFLGKNSFAARAQAPVEALLSGDTAALSALQQARQGILPITAEQSELFEQKLKQLEGGSLQAQLTAEQQSKANIESFQLDNTPGARNAAARKIIQETLDEQDFGLVRGKLARSAAQVGFQKLTEEQGIDPESAAIRILNKIAANKDQKFFGDRGADDRSIRLLEKQIKVLEELRQSVRDQETKQAVEVNVKVRGDRVKADVSPAEPVAAAAIGGT